MASIFEINVEQIKSLDDNQLTRLLQKLLESEAVQFKIPLSSITLSTEIKAPDGGEDGRIRWEGKPTNTNWLPNNFTSFQVKAKQMGPTDCANEIINRDKTDLKPKISEVFEYNGEYILFINKNQLNQEQIDERINLIRAKLRELDKVYSATTKIDIYDANKITRWVNSFPSLVSYVQTEMLLVDYSAFFSWDRWMRDAKDFFGTKFISSEGIDTLMATIKAGITPFGGKQRIIGLPGLGKTRIVYEVFNSSSELQNSLLYTNTNYSDETNIFNGIRELIRDQSDIILVIDNCTLTLYRKILHIIKGCKIRLITINNDFSNIEDEKEVILLDPEKFIEIIPRMLKELFPDISDSDAKKITEFSMGFPLVAELLAKDRRSGSMSLGRLNDSELVDRLIGCVEGDSSDNKLILMACSIFDKLGFDEELRSQRIAVSRNKSITHLSDSEDNAAYKFYSCCLKYIAVGIIEKAGRYIYVKPKPLALRLAGDWWRECPPELIPEILEYIDSCGLSEALCDQISKLDFLPRAQEVTAELCGETGPFGNAEVLNTQQGSRLFRSLVEVNPQATCDTLFKLFFGKSREYLKLIVEGRRNLVWALEKLCFWDDTFVNASKVLLSFAAAENEEMITNNATGQFLQLFQILLPGTRATLVERQKLIEFALSTTEFQQLGISALSRSLQTDHFSRLGNVESQGSRSTLMDFYPTYEDGVEYWKSSIMKLEKILVEDAYHKLQVKEIFLQKLAGLVRNRSLHLISLSLYKILEVLPESRLEVFRATKKAIALGGKFISQKEEDELNKLLEASKPQSFVERYRLFFAVPDYSYTTIKSYDDQLSDTAKEMAQEFLVTGLSWADSCAHFMSLDQQGGYIFGKHIGVLLNGNTEYIKEIISLSISELKRIPIAERNINVLKGIIGSIQEPKLRSEIITSLFSDDAINYLAVEILSSLKPTTDELFQLFIIVDKGIITIDALAHFKYGKALYHLLPDEVIGFCRKISSYGHSGNWTSLAIIFMYSYQNEDRLKACESFIKEILQTKDLILIEARTDAMDIHYWESLSQRLLLNGDTDYAIHVSKEIVKYATAINKSNIDTEVKNVILTLVERYFEVFWRYISEVIISDEFDFFKLQFLIGSRIGSPGDEIGVIFKGNLETILNWCRNNIPLAPIRIVRLAPIFDKIQGKVTWHSITRSLIDEFGNIEGFMEYLESNFNSFIWSGSLVPLIESKISLVNELLDHKFVLVSEWARSKLLRLRNDLRLEQYEDRERFL